MRTASIALAGALAVATMIELCLLAQGGLSVAYASDLSWLPDSVAEKLRASKPPQSPSAPYADLFLCDPYCDWVGQFLSRAEFRAASPAMLKRARRAENQSKLRILVNPSDATQDSQLALSSSGGAGANGTEGGSQGNEGQGSNHGPGHGAPSEEESAAGWVVPVFAGAHVDTFMGESSLATSSNTDFASGSQLHANLGGGLDFEARDLGDLFGGSLSGTLDLSFWDALGQSSNVSVSNQTWTSQTFRALIGTEWRKGDSPWTLGLLLEGRDRSDKANPDSAILFSTTYIWLSGGVRVRYRKTQLQILHSLFSTTQDVDQYRGTQVDSSRFAVEFSSCAGLASIMGGEFDLCLAGWASWIDASGSGSPLQPVFTTDPVYSYKDWVGGVQFKLAEIPL